MCPPVPTPAVSKAFTHDNPRPRTPPSSRLGLSANVCGALSFQLQGLALSPLLLAPKAATTSCLLRHPEGLEDPGLREGIFILSCLPCPMLVARFFPPLEMGIKDRENSCLPLTRVEWGRGGRYLVGNEETISSQSSWVPLPQALSSMPSLWKGGGGAEGR